MLTGAGEDFRCGNMARPQQARQLLRLPDVDGSAVAMPGVANRAQEVNAPIIQNGRNSLAVTEPNILEQAGALKKYRPHMLAAGL